MFQWDLYNLSIIQNKSSYFVLLIFILIAKIIFYLIDSYNYWGIAYIVPRVLTGRDTEKSLKILKL